MATYYFRNTGNANWGTSTNWSLTDGGGSTGAVPTVADDAYFTSNSGSCTIDTSARTCKTLVFSGVGAGNYSGTLTMTNVITVAGNVTLSATMTITGTGTLIVSAAATLTSNGKTWPNTLQLSGAVIYTFGDSWTINGTFSSGNGLAGATTVAGATAGLNINCKGDLSINVSSGNVSNGTNYPTVIINGTATQSILHTPFTSGTFRLPITISNSNTVISGNIGFGGPVFTANTSATTTGSTFYVLLGCTFSGSLINWNNLSLTGGAVTYNLVGDLNILGTFSLGSAGTTTVINATSSINAKGNLFINTTSGVINAGALSPTIILNGTSSQIWSHPSITTVGSLRTNLTINNSNTIISGTVGYSSGTITALTSSTTTGSTLLCLGGCTLTGSSITWNNVTMNNAVTYTLGTNLYVGGTLNLGTGISTTTTLSSAAPTTIYLTGNLTVNTTTGQVVGSNVTILMNGTASQTWSHTNLTSGYLRVPLTISNSNVIVSGSVGYGVTTLTTTTSAITTNSTLLLGASCTLNIGSVTWNNITCGSLTAQTYTLASNLYVSGILAVLATNTTISGATYTVYLGGYTSNTGSSTLTINCPMIFNGSGAINMGGNSVILTSSIVNINTTGTVTIPTGSAFFLRANATGVTFSYTAGTFLPAQGSTLIISNATSNYTTIVDFPNIPFWNVSIGSQNTPGAITLLSDLICDGGTFTFAPNGSVNFTINGNKNIYVGKNLMTNFVNSSGGGSSISGNSTFIFGGSGQSTFTSLSTTSNVLINNNITFNFNGVLTFYDPTSTSGFPGLSLGTGTYSYISGKIQSKDYSGKINNGTITINSACTLLGFNEMIGFGNVSITGGTTIIMDKFFNGSSKNILKVRSTNTTNYIISFQDTFEKLSNFTKLSNCTVTNRNQLLLLSQRGNGGSNIGVRYVNQLPNSIQKSSNFSSVYLTGASDITYLDGGLLQDPNTTSNYNY